MKRHPTYFVDKFMRGELNMRRGDEPENPNLYYKTIKHVMGDGSVFTMRMASYVPFENEEDEWSDWDDETLEETDGEE